MDTLNINRAFKFLLFLFVPLFLTSCITTQEDILYLNNQIVALNNKVTKMEERISGDIDSIHQHQAESVGEIDKVNRHTAGLGGERQSQIEIIVFTRSGRKCGFTRSE